tara:strand:- start:645 stop:890 length:246 start_codon:yes stop_codon:yes gene_type:complete
VLRVVPGDGTSVMVVVTPVADTLSVMSVSVQLLAPTMFVVVMVATLDTLMVPHRSVFLAYRVEDTITATAVDQLPPGLVLL